MVAHNLCGCLINICIAPYASGSQGSTECNVSYAVGEGVESINECVSTWYEWGVGGVEVPESSEGEDELEEKG